MGTLQIIGSDITWEMVERQLKSKRYEYSVFNNNNSVIIYDIRKHKYGIARKHPDDIFDFRIGCIVAWCKLKNLPLPTEFRVWARIK